MNLLFDVAIKSVGLLTIVLALCLVLRKASPALRHRVLALGFLCLAGLPLLLLRLPEIKVERPGPVLRYAPQKSNLPIQPSALSASPSAPSPMERPEPKSVIFIPELVVLLWGLVALFLVGRMALQLIATRSLLKGGEDLAVEPCLGLPPHIRLVRSSKIDVPVTFGYLRPTILLPRGSESWSEQRLASVLLHEGAHVRRADWLWLMASRLLSAIYWPNPLVHLAAARMRLEAELAADDAVIHAGVDTASYATTLVDLAEGLRNRTMSTALPFVETASLKKRIVQILSATGNRKPLGRGVAVITLCLTVACVLPYAALRIVEGPTKARDGIVPLPEGRLLEVIAITEMRGNLATSWNVKGALMPRTFPIGETNRNELNASVAGDIVRYVILRTDDSDGEIPTLFSPTGDPLTTVGYVEQTDGTGQVFRDAIGGRYFVARLTAPSGARSASIETDLPSGNWKLLASQDFREGEVVGLLNPTVGMHVAPMIPARGKGIEASFNLPADQARSEAMVRFLPDNQDSMRFSRMSGALTAYSSLDIEHLTRVEVLTRPMRKVELSDLPLNPNPSATYAARNFLPDGIETASKGPAQLADGSTITLAGLGDKAGTWSPEGKPLAAADMPRGMGRNLPEVKIKDRHLVNLWIQTNLSGFRWDEWDSGDSARDIQMPRVYDGEGWPLFGPYSSAVFSHGTLEGYFSVLDPALKERDVVVPVAAGSSKVVARVDRNAKGATWHFAKKGGWMGSLRVEYPLTAEDAIAGMDAEIRPIDAEGLVVSQEGTARTSESSTGWVEFDLPKAKADRVVAIEFRARPYTWIRFPNVALTAKGN